ncbi:hypothetical protein MTX78_13475 [Hymenobacter tibetensis]|uniref:Uncharacterized protein n=1 Tax=Hymenobacter tibetensis TaxID=497967 RepID=A0ABY4CSC3_9BACT|nr:hypothetical protein [Hymenobacter tibetensis]UOG73135.1 hypothetical protein MTX78_13475 [Hymenobacter tibetensis]
MEPNQSGTPTNEAGGDQPQNAQQPSSTNSTTSGAPTSNTSNATGQQSADSQNWKELANPQNLQKVVDQLPQGVKDFFANSWSQVGKTWGQVGGQVNKMSTTQKVAGAAALVGIGYLAMRSGKKSSSKSASRYKSSPSTTPAYQRHEQNYSGSGSSASARPDESRRMDRGPGHWNSGSGFDRENASRTGGTYSSDASSTAGYSGSDSQSSSAYRGVGSQGSTGSSSSTSDSDYDSAI